MTSRITSTHTYIFEHELGDELESYPEIAIEFSYTPGEAPHFDDITGGDPGSGPSIDFVRAYLVARNGAPATFDQAAVDAVVDVWFLNPDNRTRLADHAEARRD